MEYTLFENKLTRDIEDDYSAKHVNSIKLNREDLIKSITGPGSILKDTETKAVIEAYWNQIMRSIAEGKEYRDEHLSINLSISGAFMGKDARFNPEEHEVNVSFNPSKLVKNAARDIRPQYVDPDYDRAIVDQIKDWMSNAEDSTITPNGVLEIKGRDLKIYEAVEGAGVFFINKETGDEVKVLQFRTNEPRTLHIITPDLGAGKYRLEVRNSARDGMKLRIGGADVEYTVE